MEKNKPYVKEYDVITGELINVIDKYSPYLNENPETRQMRRGNEKLIIVPIQTKDGNSYTTRLLKRTKSQKRKQNWH